MEMVSEVWPGPLPHGYLRVFVGLPSKVGSPGKLTAHNAGMTETCEWILFFSVYGRFGHVPPLFSPIQRIDIV
jgi:hypothetical protein